MTPASRNGRGNGGQFGNTNNNNPSAFMTTQNVNSFVATPETVCNHVTIDYNNIHNPVEYGGTKLVTIGNGEKLCISYIGNSVLFDGKNSFNLRNVLCVPTIDKNLFSVSQLARDNAILIEFHGDYWLIKDKATGNTLLKGELNDGLYWLEEIKITRNRGSKGEQPLNTNKNTTTLILFGINVNVNESRTVWHLRLGHPSSKVLNYILRYCNVFAVSNEEMLFCDSCQ